MLSMSAVDFNQIINVFFLHNSYVIYTIVNINEKICLVLKFSSVLTYISIYVAQEQCEKTHKVW